MQSSKIFLKKENKNFYGKKIHFKRKKKNLIKIIFQIRFCNFDEKIKKFSEIIQEIILNFVQTI